MSSIITASANFSDFFSLQIYQQEHKQKMPSCLFFSVKHRYLLILF